MATTVLCPLCRGEGVQRVTAGHKPGEAPVVSSITCMFCGGCGDLSPETAEQLRKDYQMDMA